MEKYNDTHYRYTQKRFYSGNLSKEAIEREIQKYVE